MSADNAILAILPKTEQSNARNLDKKETVQQMTVVAFRDGKFYHPITARFFVGRSANSSVVHCALWIHNDEFSTSGSGQAGGYGYHKMSEALDRAIESAGITLSRSIGGVGDGAMRDALTAIASALGYDQITIV